MQPISAEVSLSTDLPNELEKSKGTARGRTMGDPDPRWRHGKADWKMQTIRRLILEAAAQVAAAHRHLYRAQQPAFPPVPRAS